MLFRIQLAYTSGPPHGQEAINAAVEEFCRLVTNQTPVNDAYALLSVDQRSVLREMIENPAVPYYSPDGSEPFLNEKLALLDRLERGLPVAPVPTWGNITQASGKAKSGRRSGAKL